MRLKMQCKRQMRFCRKRIQTRCLKELLRIYGALREDSWSRAIKRPTITSEIFLPSANGHPRPVSLGADNHVRTTDHVLDSY